MSIYISGAKTDKRLISDSNVSVYQEKQSDLFLIILNFLYKDKHPDFWLDLNPFINIVDSVPLSLIETDPSIQGGQYCLQGTRVPITSIKENFEEGYTLKEIAQNLKKYFQITVSPEKIDEALKKYDYHSK